MAKKTTITLDSNFRAAKHAGEDAINDLLRKATEQMHDVASQRLDKAAGQRGYSLYSTDLDFDTGDKRGEITYKQWYGRFFEYGTPSIQAMPFMRPAYRAGRKIVKTEAPEVFDRWFNRKLPRAKPGHH